MTSFSSDEVRVLELLKDYGPYYDRVLKQSYRYKLALTADVLKTGKVEVVHPDNETKTHSFIPIGSLQGNTFSWYKGMNKFIYDTIFNSGLESIKHSLIKKLCTPEVVTLPGKYKKVIPYLVALINPSFKVLESESPDPKNKMVFFFATDLNIRDDYDFDGFLKALSKPRRGSRKNKR
jgi:hypothetical protein